MTDRISSLSPDATLLCRFLLGELSLQEALYAAAASARRHDPAISQPANPQPRHVPDTTAARPVTAAGSAPPVNYDDWHGSWTAPPRRRQ